MANVCCCSSLYLCLLEFYNQSRPFLEVGGITFSFSKSTVSDNLVLKNSMETVRLNSSYFLLFYEVRRTSVVCQFLTFFKTRCDFICLFDVCFPFTAMVRKEIQEETDRMTGRSKQISPIPIHLSIYSPNGKVDVLPFYQAPWYYV